MKFLKNIWKQSKLRFYIKNTLWNYKFWLFSKKVFKNVTYQTDKDDYTMDFDFTLKKDKKIVSKRRFIGYFFENNVYLDNPGIKIKDRKLWKKLKK